MFLFRFGNTLHSRPELPTSLIAFQGHSTSPRDTTFPPKESVPSTTLTPFCLRLFLSLVCGVCVCPCKCVCMCQVNRVVTSVSVPV